jgi:hypothetical protein
MPTGKQIQLDVSLSDTVPSLKGKIEEKEGLFFELLL